MSTGKQLVTRFFDYWHAGRIDDMVGMFASDGRFHFSAITKPPAVGHEEIREFLARHAEQNEREWARDFAGEVFNLMSRSPSSYAAVTQTVVAQANISRSSVVSLLS